ncbi:MAG TPA: delta-60 repeat domain-containing protein [Blastocatellia bacterium]|jgi:uncharacterized delta-60 repeat protein
MNNSVPSKASARRWLKRKARATVAVTAIAILMSGLPPARVVAAAGDLDASFGTGGKVVTEFFGRGASACDMAVQPDGKIIAAGTVARINAGNVFGLARYNSDGSLDPAFGSGGVVVTENFNQVSLIRAIALQPDGKIVVAGDWFPDDSSGGFSLARYNSNGSVDLTFGDGGLVINESQRLKSALQIAVLPGGKIIIAGTGLSSSGGFLSGDFLLMRYNADGSLDSTFGSGGVVTTDFFDTDDSGGGLVLQPDGKIVMAGAAFTGTVVYFALARYNAEGSLDPSFGAGGKVHHSFFGLSSAAMSLARQPDGKLVAAGFAGTDFGVARYNADGSLDATFGVEGKVLTDFDKFDIATEVAIQPDGKIIVGGYREFSTETGDYAADFIIARYNADGGPDATFGAGGKIITDLFNSADVSFALALQPDGKIIQGGSTSGPDKSGFALVRYNGDATSFNLCLQDDSNGNMVKINSATGLYQFTNCSGLTVEGTGSMTLKGGLITLQHNAPDRRVLAKVDTSTNKATATIQLFSQGATFTVTDRNTANNTCACR